MTMKWAWQPGAAQEGLCVHSIEGRQEYRQVGFAQEGGAGGLVEWAGQRPRACKNKGRDEGSHGGQA